jgi:hypothetical protein
MASTAETYEEMLSRKRAELAAMEVTPWFAVSVIPGSQKPRREYAAEKTRSHKGYRIITNIDHDVSAVERSLVQSGFQCYMPAEKRLLRDRRHTDLWKVRRFALMVGYVFVQNPTDFGKLRDVWGVQGIVSDQNGVPLPILLEEILMLRAAEADAEKFFDAKSKLARQVLRKKAKNDPRLKMLTEKLDMAGKITIPLNGDILSATLEKVA